MSRGPTSSRLASPCSLRVLAESLPSPPSPPPPSPTSPVVWFSFKGDVSFFGVRLLLFTFFTHFSQLILSCPGISTQSPRHTLSLIPHLLATTLSPKMKTFAAVSAFVALAVSAQAATVQSPPQLIQCQVSTAAIVNVTIMHPVESD